MRFGNPSIDNKTWLNDGLMKFSADRIDFDFIHPLQKTCEFWNEKKDLYKSLDPQSSLSGVGFAEVFVFLFFVCFIKICHLDK
jgi:hypothetical protein